MNVRVEYEATPIRHVAVQCPECERWYDGRDITDTRISDESDLYHAQFCCPVCGHTFGANSYQGLSNLVVKECASSTEVYEGCLKRKEIWE